MANISYTNTFATGIDAELGAKIQANFDSITTAINGNLDQDNLAAAADLSVSKITASTKFIAPGIKCASLVDMIFDIATFAGSKLKITNSDNATLFEIDTDGTMKIGA